MNHEECLELTEVYALNALVDDELSQLEAHLASGCAQCRAHLRRTTDALAMIPGSYEPLKPSPAVKTRLFEQIDTEKPGFIFTLAKQGQWQEMAPGITAKILNIDTVQQRVTALVRMAPGSRYDDHRHTLTEELFVIEGSCYCGGQLLRQGDYHRAEAGSIHLDTRTDEGSLMLLITSVQNEMLT